MRNVLETLERKMEEFAKEPLFDFLRNTDIPPRQRLSFVPVLAHFVMTFSDIYALVLREEPARDRYQELVNDHTYEDGGHWRWFLADLGKLGHDPQVTYSDAIRFIWGDATIHMRRLSYGLCQLSHNADSLHKLVLVQCIEAAGKISLENVAIVGKEISDETGKALAYFGPHHFDTESNHTIEAMEIQQMLREIEIEPTTSERLISVIEQSFALFSKFIQELLEFTKSDQHLEIH